MKRICIGLLATAIACSSSETEPIDPVAVDYCAACSELPNCESVVNGALSGICPEQTSAWYACVTNNACDETACTAEWAAREGCMGTAPKDKVRARIASLAPSANLGHRGTGITGTEGAGNPLPENSIASFVAAMEQGADGIELDVEITKDGKLIVMHDGTVDRTTTCTGCVSDMTFDEVRACRLLDNQGNPTDEIPPTLSEVYGAIAEDALVDVELKVYGPSCLTDTTGPDALVPLALDEVTQIGSENRTLFSSFDETAAGLVKTEQPGYYSGLLATVVGAEEVDKALMLNQDAIHPFFSVSSETVQNALDAGLQVNVWTVDTAESMQETIDKGSTAIITDNPGILAELLAP